MIEAAGFTFAMVLSFVFSSAVNNNRANRPHPPIMRYVGWGLVGALVAVSAVLIISIPLGIDLTRLA